MAYKWDDFRDSSIRKIFRDGGKIVDIGGGLRIKEGKGNRFEKRFAIAYSQLAAKVDYRVVDYSAQYNPDEIQDIHSLSYEHNTIDGIFCIAVFEHIEDPKKAAAEILRVLKVGGSAFLYLPFLYRYHAHPPYYGDFYRYTRDSINYLFSGASHIEIVALGGMLEAFLKMTPLATNKYILRLVRAIDSTGFMKSIGERQTSGFNVLVTK